MPVFSKGLEKIILSRMSNFCDKHSILNDAQFGFRKHRSTELALLEQKEFILNCFENKTLSLAIFVDFTKAFDYLNHDLLLKKLEIYGFRGNALALLTSYLGSRKQFVQLDGHSSDIKPILSGVPQGSILGPFLFNIYLNDIINIDNVAKFVIFADDTTLLFSEKCPSELISRANATLVKLERWTLSNALKINTSKTKAVLFRPKNKNICVYEDINLFDSKIELVSAFKTLGVVFTERMTWEEHTNHVVSKLSSIIGLTYIHRQILPTRVKLLVHNTLFYSHINYCHLVWGNTTLQNLQKVYLLQKKMLRNIDNVPYDHPSAPLFQKHGIMNIHNMYAFRLSITYKQEAKNNTNLLTQLAHLCKRTITYPTRSIDIWNIYSCKTSYGEQMMQRKLPELLNFCNNRDIQLESTSKKDLKFFFSNTSMKL